jgi:myxalamid-type polyketide synthase MxaB
MLEARAAAHPGRKALTFLADGSEQEITLTYAELRQQALSIAQRLTAAGSRGDRAAILCPPGLDYLCAFLGCQYAGMTAVPLFPPRRAEKSERLTAVLTDADVRLALTTSSVLEHEQNLAKGGPYERLTWVATDKAEPAGSSEFVPHQPVPEDLAFLQYTSGSTATPKGVMVSHFNILTNLRYFEEWGVLSPENCAVSWLPLFHDMGLISALYALNVGTHLVLMTPLHVVQRPYLWLKAISRYRAAFSGGPNFLYDLCCRKITAEQRTELDLSSWGLAFTGAEPVRAATVEKFRELFGSCGFGRGTFVPCYGLAEFTLGVAGSPAGREPVIRRVRRSDLGTGRFTIVNSDEADTLEMVSCGKTGTGHEVRIVDTEKFVVLPEGEIGEIWARGPSMAGGYWNKPQETAERFNGRLSDGTGPFLRTGDLGVLHDSELYIVGRLKDVIIINGANHYPQDIELTAERAHEAVASNGAAAFSVDTGAGEQIVVVAEVGSGAGLQADAVIRAVREAVTRNHDLRVSAVTLIKPGRLPRTTSGKVRRRDCCQLYQQGTLQGVLASWRAEEPKTAALTPTTPPPAGDGAACTVQAASPAKSTSDVAPVVPGRSVVEVQNWIITRLATELGCTAQDIDPAEQLTAFGFDSLKAVQLSQDLGDWLGRKLSPTLAWDHPTIERLARYLGSEVGSRQSAVGSRQSPGLLPTADCLLPTEQEPLAIVGMSCRFAGAESLDAFLRLLRFQGDGIVEVPAERWITKELYDPNPATPGKTTSRWLGALKNVDQFDAGFFNITPREAKCMDPQQRLLLETAWEAFEHAGLASERFVGSRTGVYVGIGGYDYSNLLCKSDNHLVAIEAYTGTGNAHSIAANRISYAFDLRGPSMAVDTACSSGLLALHLACQAIRSGECDMALAGAVNLVLSPEVTVAFSKANMLSPEGRCKSFDDSADGYVRGEGCAVLVVKRLADAQRDGDRVLAVLHGTAANQDGRTNGITAPSGPAQQEVIQNALRRSGVTPEQVGYLETHGTATPLGDPIELNALKEVFSDRGPEGAPCYFGSVKSNIGHTETVSGLAGVIKVALMMQQRELFPQVHLQALNHRIELAGSPLCPSLERKPWPDIQGRRLAGVSSFGFGGTNVHVVLEEPSPVTPPAARTDRPLHLLTLTAKTEPSLKELAQRYRNALRPLDARHTADFCFTANAGRTPFAHRLALVGSTGEQLAEQLEAWLAGQKIATIQAGQVKAAQMPKVAFLFTGQGSQSVGMARRLYETSEQFRATIDRCDAILRPRLGESLVSILYGTAGQPGRIDRTAITQPALFAIEYALAELWMSWGIRPAAVMGHSVGEYVAACIAGCFTLEEGLQLIAERGRLMNALPAGGTMAAVFAPEADVASLVERFADRVSVAAVNGPESVVIAGEAAAVESILAELKGRGVRSQPLKVSHAFHSPLMEPMLDEFTAIAAKITFQPPQLPLVSNLTGKALAQGESLSAEYWRKHVRQAVRFSEGVETLVGMGCDVFVEVGPAPHLSSMGRRIAAAAEKPWVISLRPGCDDWQQMLTGLATLYVHGSPVSWQAFDKPYSRAKQALPSYPFQRQRYWLEAAPKAAPAPVAKPAVRAGHPLLGTRLRSALPTAQFEAEVSLASVAWLGDHRVKSAAVVPAAGYLEMALAALHEVGQEQATVQNVQFQEALLLPRQGARLVQVALAPEAEGKRTFQIYSTGNAGTGPWKLHAQGLVGREEASNKAADSNLKEIRNRCTSELKVADYYADLARCGLNYGPCFQAITQLWAGSGEAVGRLEAPAALAGDLDTCRFHPSLLDGAFQVFGAALRNTSVEEDLYVPVGVASLRLHGRPGSQLWAHAVLSATENGEVIEGDVTIFDDKGGLLAEVKGLRLRRMGRPRAPKVEPADPLKAATDWLYRVDWKQMPLREAATRAIAKGPNKSWVIFADKGGVGEKLARLLGRRGVSTVLVFAGEVFEDNAPGRFTVNVCRPERVETLLQKTFSAEVTSCAGVVHLWGLDADPQGGSFAQAVDRAIPLTCASIARVVQNVTTLDGPPKLYLVTRGARTISESRPLSLLQSPIAGLGMTVLQEYPELACSQVDLDVEGDVQTDAEALLQEVLSGDGEDQVAYRDGLRHAPRLSRLAAETLSTKGINLRADATYLVAGGLGSGGLAVAEWLADQGARHLVLAGRNVPPPAAPEVVARLRTAGVVVEVARCDFASKAEVTAFLAGIGEKMPPLRGVFHLGSVFDNAPIVHLNRERFDRSLAPKVLSAWNLHRATKGYELDHFVLFSSVASVLGAAGQANYAAGNAFLDALVQARRSRGLPALSVSWGPWEMGMASSEAHRKEMIQRGFRPLEARVALGVLGRLLTQKTGHLVVTSADWKRVLQPWAETGRVPRIVADLAEPTSAPTAEAKGQSDLRSRLEAMPASQRPAFLAEHFAEHLAEVTSMKAAEINRDEPLANLGLDSLMLFELKRRIESSLHVTIPTGRLFESPSVRQLAECVLELLAEREATAPAAAKKPRKHPPTNGSARSEMPVPSI